LLWGSKISEKINIGKKVKNFPPCSSQTIQKKGQSKLTEIIGPQLTIYGLFYTGLSKVFFKVIFFYRH